MVAAKWGSATDIYNTCLEAKGKETATKIFKKNPRALTDKLASIEQQITTRLFKQDFHAINSQSEDFWKEHCHAVKALVLKSTNHRRNCCTDGVSVTLKPEPQLNEEEITLPHALPPWPQPLDIFTDGKHFNPQQFLLKVRDLYEKVMEQEDRRVATGSTDSRCIGNYTLEEQAFSSMLSARSKSVDGHTYFRLYPNLTFNSQISFESLISTIHGHHYLQIDCLGLSN
ncbi:hypothetical protein BJ912DRAFT_866428 [Pholiota molesta]|nr:hypothetical protein BJ912DRAFT_866428 [Pholiota molesta]